MVEDIKEMLSHFKLTCRNCNSENVVIQTEDPKYYSEETGWDPATIAIGCNECKKNDFFTSL